MLATTCPHCATSFRVNSDQLKLRGGLVRCGACSQVFNGLEHLTYVDSEHDVQEEDSKIFERVPLTEQATEPTINTAWPQSNLDETPVAASHPRQPAPSQATNEWASGQVMPKPSTRNDAYLASSTPQSTQDEPEHRKIQTPLSCLFENEVPMRAQSRWTTLLMYLGVVFVFLQLLFLARHEISQSLPASRPIFLSMCQLLACTVDLAKDAQSILIESVDLQQDPQKPEQYSLSAVLRNRSSKVLEYPALELTLSNVLGRVEARKVFLANEYLSQGQEKSQDKFTDKRPEGMAPRSELLVKLVFVGKDLSAVNYNLIVFYP